MKNDYFDLKIKLIKSKNGEGIYILPKIKQKYGYKEYSKTINSLLNNTAYKDYFSKELFPNNINNIITIDNIPLISLNNEENLDVIIKQELLCFFAFFENFERKLYDFNNFRNQFEQSIFWGDFDEAEKKLQEVESVFGQSFWLLESKLLLWNFNKSYTEAELSYQTLKKECTDNYILTFLRTLRHRVNYRENVDESLSFIDKKLNYLKNTKKHSIDRIEYFYFSAYSPNKLEKIDYYNLLHMASSLNLVDMYILINKILERYVLDDSIEQNNRDELIAYILSSKIDSSISEFIKNLTNTESPTQTQLNQIKKLFVEEKYKGCLELCQKLLENKINFSVLVIYVKTKLFLKPNEIPHDRDSLLLNVCNIIENILLKNINYNDFYQFRDCATRYLYMLSSTSINYGYKNFLYENFYSDNNYSNLLIITNGCYKANNKLLELFKVDSSPKEEYEINWIEEINILPNVKYDKTSCLLHEVEQYSIEKLSKIVRENVVISKSAIVNELLYNKAGKILFERYIENQEYLKAIELYNDLQFISKLKVINFNTDLLNSKIQFNLNKFYGELDFCIYAHLVDFRNMQGKMYNVWVANSVRTILKNNNVIFPSELKMKKNAKYSYFCRHVCSKEILRKSIVYDHFNNESESFALEHILKERKKLLNIALDYDTPDEKDQILSQINIVEKEIENIKKRHLFRFSESKEKILEESIYVSERNVIYPFFCSLDRIRNETICNFDSIESGEYLIFKDSFVRFKKAYIENLNEQIGINIRHGFFNNEIVNYFEKHSLLLKREIDYIELSSVEKLKQDNKDYLIPYIDELKDFSEELYCFIDRELYNLNICHSSKESEAANYFFVSEETILEIAQEIIKFNNPYEVATTLISHLNHLAKNNLIKMGDAVKNNIAIKCNRMLNNLLEKVESQSELANLILKAIEDLPNLAHSIQCWFNFIKEKDKQCSLNEYCESLKKKNQSLLYEFMDDDLKFVTLKQLHYIDLILGNLIVNAYEHSGAKLNENPNILIQFKTIQTGQLSFSFSNSLYNKSKTEMLQIIENIEKMSNLNNENFHVDENTKGNGFKVIFKTLKTISALSKIAFDKNELPSKFKLDININWGD